MDQFKTLVFYKVLKRLQSLFYAYFEENEKILSEVKLQGIAHLSWKYIQGTNATITKELEALVEYFDSLSTRALSETQLNFVHFLNARELIAGQGDGELLAKFDHEMIEMSWKFGKSPFSEANMARIEKVKIGK